MAELLLRQETTRNHCDFWSFFYLIWGKAEDIRLAGAVFFGKQQVNLPENIFFMI
jgi:hypothetical protein